jgi:preprotein translocase subunit YajC
MNNDADLAILHILELEEKEMARRYHKGQRVASIGGKNGTIVRVGQTTITIEWDDGTQTNILKVDADKMLR